MKKLIIIGAGGHGKVVADIADLLRYEEICFLDDGFQKKCLKYSVAGKVEEVYKYVKDWEFFVAVGSLPVREQILGEIELLGGKIATLIHPKAIVAQDVKIGRGSVVMAGAIINPDTKIGKGVIINTGSSVDHDCVIGDYGHVSVGAHIAGGVFVGKRCMIGAGATVINGLSICDNCIIGAGAVVVKNLEQSGTYIGVPAKMIIDA